MPILNRRSFCRAVAGNTAAFSLTGSACSARPEQTPHPRFGTWNVGIAYWSLREFPIEVQMAITAGLGLDYYEPSGMITALKSEPAMSTDEIQTLYRAYGLKQAVIYGSITEDEAQARDTLTLAKAAGFTTIATGSGGPQVYDLMEKLADELDMRIALHNHGPKDLHHGRSEQVVRALEGRSTRMGACVDVAWSLMSDEDPVAIVRTLGSRVLAIHLRDHTGADMESECTLGAGRLDLSGLMQALKASNFQGLMSIETVKNPANPLPDIRAHLDAIERTIQQM